MLWCHADFKNDVILTSHLSPENAMQSGSKHPETVNYFATIAINS